MIRAVTWVDADGNRYPLTDPAGSTILLEGAIGLDAAPVDIRSDDRPGDGAVLSNVRAPAKTLALPILCEDLDELDEIADRFIGRTSTLEVYNGVRSRELIDVYYVGGLEGDASAGRYQDGSEPWRTYVVELKALDPFWYGPPESMALGVPESIDAYNAAIGYNTPKPYNGPAAGISAGIGYNTATGYNTARPYNGGVNISFGVTSRLGAWPVITVNGPASTFQMVHLRTGQLVKMRTGVTLGDDQKLVVDCRPTTRSVRRDGTLAWEMITPDSDPGMAIVAGDGVSFILGGTDAGSYILAEWRQRWRMP